VIPDPEKKKGRSLHKEHCGQEPTRRREGPRLCRSHSTMENGRPTARTFDSSETRVADETPITLSIPLLMSERTEA